MGLYDASDQYLKRAVASRKSADGANMKIVGPIIKLKTEQFKVESLNMDSASRLSKLQKIAGVLEKKIQESEKGGAKLSLKSEVKTLFIRQKLQKKMVNVMLESESKVSDSEFSKAFSATLATLGEMAKKVEKQEDMQQMRAKAHFKFALFADKVLRRLETDEETELLEKALKKEKKSKEEFARLSITNGLAALNLDYPQASDVIPRMLDVVGKFGKSVEADFAKHSKDTPTWVFLR